MGTLTSLLFVYVLGGVTFLPLVLLAIFLHGYYMLPVRDEAQPPASQTSTATADDKDGIVQPGDDVSAIEAARKDEAKIRASRDLDVAAGYFAVCREYTPMGINAKPIERATPVGNATVAAPSPSVYQTMYRSIFERRSMPGPLDNSGAAPRPKRAGNVFYVVLRHGHLMLFDDDEQLEVRHVISLAHHDVSIYSGGDVTPEGELFIKRNALCLSRRQDGPDTGPDGQLTKPFYLFSENCSAKEDFYFSLLKNQEQTFRAGDTVSTPKHFDVKHIISLVQRLHSTEDHVHTRWLNAMIGRIFLALYRTSDLENFIREKITKKISRVKTPAFLTNIAIRRIDTGEAAPYFTNFKLKDLTAEGECLVEADVRYTGNFRLEVAATAKLDLGTRFKAREVNMVLAVLMKKLEGHLLFKIKAPPSNRIWFSFQTMPKLEMLIEPVVSARQITYTIILRQIENRIKEVLAETLVQPSWDDIPFFKTEHKKWRGGIFEGDDAIEPSESVEGIVAQNGQADTLSRFEETGSPKDEFRLKKETRPFEKSHTIPVMESSPQPSGLTGRKAAKNGASASSSASSTSVDKSAPPMPTMSPKIMNNTPEPTIGTDASHADLFRPSSSPPDHATSYMAALNTRSQEALSMASPSSSPTKVRSVAQSSDQSAASSVREGKGSGEQDEAAEAATPLALGRRNTASSSESGFQDSGIASGSPTAASFVSQTGSIGRNFFSRRDDTNFSPAGSSTGSDHSQQSKRNTLAAVSNAAAHAKQWGWNAFQRQKEARKQGDTSSQVDLNQPMGRGQPLPPPGTPLPGPPNGRAQIGGPATAPKRKPVASPMPERKGSYHSSHEDRSPSGAAPPLPDRRRRGRSYDDTDDSGEQNIFVVAAPADDSLPATPADEREDYLAPFVEEPQPAGGSDSAAASIRDTASVKTAEPESSPDMSIRPSPSVDQLQTGKSVAAEPAKSAPPIVDDNDDDGYAGWMEEDNETAAKENDLTASESTVPNEAEVKP